MTSSLKSVLGAALADVFVSAGFDAGPPIVQEAKPGSEFDYQTAHALRAGTDGLALAHAVANALADHAWFSDVSVSGKGFLNLRLADSVLLENRFAAAAASKRVLVDFGGPNIAKPLHVGHLRSLTIGESLRRILVALGHDVVADVHYGDWGMPMGQIIAHAISTAPPSVDAAAWVASMPDDAFDGLYAAAAGAAKSSEQAMEMARRTTVLLQERDAHVLSVWKALKERSLLSVHKVFGIFDAHFDLLLGESDADADQLDAHCEAAGLSRISEGATIIDVAREADGKRPLPPLILRKSDGGLSYAATDLATVIERFEELSIDEVVYVVDQRQADHFEQVRRAANLFGIDEDRLLHAGFGTVNDVDGKPLRSRDGGAPKLFDLVEDSIAAVSSVAVDLSDDDKLAIAVGGLKFADLQGPRASGYCFVPEKASSVEGDSGPYLQYACVRARSVLSKADGTSTGTDPLSPAARDLHLEIVRLEDAVEAAGKELEPCRVAQQGLRIARAFNRFYGEAQIVGAADQGMRLEACKRAVDALGRTCDLLGMRMPSRM